MQHELLKSSCSSAAPQQHDVTDNRPTGSCIAVQAMKQLLREKERSDPKGWAQTQHHIQTAKLQRTRLTREIEDLKSSVLQADVEASQGMSPSLHWCHVACTSI